MTKKRRGRPPRSMIYRTLKREWIEIGAYDKHYPAANRMWRLMRDGVPRAEALEIAAIRYFDGTCCE